MDALSGLLSGFATALSPQTLLACFVGVLAGTVGGVLPGLGPTGTMALLLPFTFTLDPTSAMILLAGIFYGSQYGNSTSAILLNIPGDPGALATTLDGNQLAKQGKAGPALFIAAMASFFASVIGTFGIMTLSQSLVPIALSFGPPEFFALMLLGLCLVSSLSTGSTLKSMVMATLGVGLTLVGSDPVSGALRYTFGMPYLYGGLGLIPIAMGFFAVGELLINMESVKKEAMVEKIQRFFPTREELRDSFWLMIRGSVLGFFVGVLPGAGAAPAAFASYGLEKRIGKGRDRMGHGAIEGVAAPEAANNAAAAGSFVPLLSMGIPGSAPSAVIIGALVVFGIRPGPLFIAEQPQMFWGLVASLFIANILLLILNLPLVGMWAKLLSTPFPLLQTIIFVVSVAGVYTINNSLFDVWVMLVVGAFSYFLRRADYPMAPALLGFVLGGMMEESFRQALIISRGDAMVFVERPITLALLLLSLLAIVGSIYPVRTFKAIVARRRAV